MNNPLISVLIPAYKKEWLDLAILSVLGQTEQNFEILISDDTDESIIKNIVSKYLSDKRIQYFKNPNRDGIGYNSHKLLIEKATGKYIKILHDDDLLLPNSLQLLSSMLEKNPECKMSFHHRYFIDESGIILNKFTFISGKGELILTKEQFFDLYIAKSPYNLIGEPSNVMFEREAFLSLDKPFELAGRYMKYYWDVTLYLHIVVAGFGIIGSSEFASCFRVSENQNSSSASQIFIYRLFERDLIRRWCVDNGYLTKKQFKLLKDYQLNIYSAYKDKFPELDYFEEISSDTNEYQKFLNDSFVSYVKLIDSKYSNQTIGSHFIPYRKNKRIEPKIKALAFYLPQFHPFPENDEWWGKGFTEWTNVTKAKPNFDEHYQPHFPIHSGYYDLRVPSIMEEQARLAKEFGIFGFSYYFYWFDGKTLMETPLKMMLENKNIDMPFCLTWANENWTRRWDGLDNEILIAQNHSIEDSINFIRHLIPYFKDERYIKIENKPLLVIYRPSIIPDLAEIISAWKVELKKHNIHDIYLVNSQAFQSHDYYPAEFNAALEFPPHHFFNSPYDLTKLNNLSTNFNGRILDYSSMVNKVLISSPPKQKKYRTVMLSWDNTARKQNHSYIFHNFSISKYKQWLHHICLEVTNNETHSNDEKLVFINAWNEWAEGTHLEPDAKFGYAYLQATYDIISKFK